MSAAVAPIKHLEPIVVDLDGTLVRTDTFIASAIEAVRKRPLCLFSLLAALLKGRAFCKRIAATLGRLNVESLPYNEPLLEFLRTQKSAGRHLILATGADVSIANSVAAYLGIFDDVIASDGERNLTGAAKLRVVQERLGGEPFTYVGNSHADLHVWSSSGSAILVGAPRRCARVLRNAGIPIHQEFEGTRLNPRAIIKCLRPHQWTKNVLVFVPIVLAHKLRDPAAIIMGLLAFLALSFCASALYVVNDVLDLQADRMHPSKRRRPLASGAVTVPAGLAMSAFMVVSAAALVMLLPWPARVLLVAYAISSLTYSLVVKRMLFLDVVSLALLYALRVLYGGSATDIKISLWTLAFSLFLFTSLATIKRVTELRRVKAVSGGTQEYRGYREIDVGQLSSLAAASGYAAVLVLALYINSPEVALLYRRPQGLWLLCPILIYWISRLTLIANRGHLDDDPVAFALKDRATWVVGIASGIVLLLST